MVPTSHLLAFAGVAAVIVAIPGPSVLFTISRALTAGRRTALLNVVGNTFGMVGQVVAVAFDLGAPADPARHYRATCAIASAMWSAEDAWRQQLSEVSIAEVAGQAMARAPTAAIDKATASVGATIESRTGRNQ